MELKDRPLNRRGTLANWRLALALAFGLITSRMAFGQVAPTWENSGYYVGPTGQISATNFVNDFGATFVINITSDPNWIAGLYDGWQNTVNLTNYGSMYCNTGFRFDTQNSSGHHEAGTFNNQGIIDCGSIFDTGLFTSNALITLGGEGILVSATNIIPGAMTVGPYGDIKLFGNNVNFDRAIVTMQNLLQNFVIGLGIPNYIALTGAFGLNNTNGWVPSLSLTPVSATTSLPYAFTFNNTTPYINIVSNATASGTNIIIRAIFMVNQNPNVTATAYVNSSTIGAGAGDIQWAGPYTDPVTGVVHTNYLYLSDVYEDVGAVNIAPNILLDPFGLPDNFTFFTQLDTPIGNGTPTPPGFPPGFSFQPLGLVMNGYSYANVQFIDTSVATNASAINPSGALTNLYGRVEVAATNELTLSLSSISGMNYTMLRATNQVNNDGMSPISTAFADFYLGTTNGNFALTNLILYAVPNWSGNMQLWSGRWIYFDANGATNDFRVLVVDGSSQLSPISPSFEQDLMLYSSNNVVISDVYNVIRTLFINSTNLVLTTNGVGNGAASLEGELNFESPTIFWSNSFPRLQVLTNGGAIRTLNVAQYGSSGQPYLSFVNNGVVSNGNGSVIWSKDFENYGSFSSGPGSFTLQSLTTTLANGSLVATGSVSITADSLVTSNHFIQAGQALTLNVTNLLTDGGAFSSNIWTLGRNYGGVGNQSGLSLPIKPPLGDLLGTIITNTAQTNVNLINTWPGRDMGKSNSGYTNNEAIGWLCLDALKAAPFTQIYFTGSGNSNAIYVDCLELRDQATNLDNSSAQRVPSLMFNTNLVIYYAQALIGGFSVAAKLDGWNTNHLRWVASYAGHFSSTNIIYPDGTTNTVNAALAALNSVDSDGDGTGNGGDPTPFFVSSQVNFNLAITNVPPKKVRLKWSSIPSSTNYVYFKTNLLSANWLTLTNFVSLSTVPPVGGWPITNIVYDAFTNQPRFYKVQVTPNNATYFPPSY